MRPNRLSKGAAKFAEASLGKQLWTIFRIKLSLVMAFLTAMLVAVLSTKLLPQNAFVIVLTLIVMVVVGILSFRKLYEWTDFIIPFEGDKDEW